MSRWFRFYDDAINDPKILKLSEDLRWHWVAVLCIASKHDGNLPDMGDVAIMLRMSRARANTLFTQLAAAGLLDRTETGFAPHNWDGRQYKSDVSTGRVKRFRETKRNVSSAVSETPPEYRTDTEDRIGDAGASAFTEGSKALATVFWKALGFESALAVHPDYAGTDWRAINWEKAGWTADLVDTETRRIGPDKPLTYYEKVFATAFAKRQAPLPIVEIKQAEKVVSYGHGKHNSNSVIAAIDRQLAALQETDGADFEMPESPVLRISG